MKEGALLCDIPMTDGTRGYLLLVAGTYDNATGRFSASQEDVVIPFTSDADEPLQLNTDKVLSYFIMNNSQSEILGYADVFLNPMIIPYRLVSAASIAPSLEPSINRAMKFNSIKAQLKSLDNIPVVRVRR